MPRSRGCSSGTTSPSTHLTVPIVGNRTFMAALDAGCASAGCANAGCAHSCGRTCDVRTGERTRKLRKRCHTPASFSLFSFLFLLSRLPFLFFPSTLLLPYVFPFLQFDTINDLHLRSIQTLCLHLSYSTPLRETQTVNHYLHIEYFQHP